MARILLVEDNQMDAELTLSALDELPGQREVHVVSNGQAALDYLAGAGNFTDRKRFPLPDLILLDLKLPVVDGYQVLTQLKSMPHVCRVPVVIFTSSIEDNDRVRCYDGGCNSYLEKPHSYEGYVELMQTLENYWFEQNVAPPFVA